MKAIIKYLWLNLLLPACWLLLCIALKPQFLFARHEGGISNYGNYLLTFIPYSAYFVSSIICLVLIIKQAGRMPVSRHANVLVKSLFIICLLEFLVLISTFPRHYGWTYSLIHDYLGAALLAAELIWSFFVVLISRGGYVYLLIEMLGSLVALLSTGNVVHLLFIGEVLGGLLGFGLVSITLLPKIITAEN